MSTSDTTARGIMVLVAIMVPKAPRGHRSENVSQPKPDRVPILTPAIRPAAMPTNTTVPTAIRSLRVFSFAASMFAELFCFPSPFAAAFFNSVTSASPGASAFS